MSRLGRDDDSVGRLEKAEAVEVLVGKDRRAGKGPDPRDPSLRSGCSRNLQPQPQPQKAMAMVGVMEG